MILQKMMHSSFDVISDSEKCTTIVHVVNEISLGGEFTICGRAITQSTLQFEGFCAIGDGYRGTLSQCDCVDCLRIISYMKKLK